MKTRFVLCITGVLLISSAVLAQTRKPDLTYPTSVQQTFSAGLKGALKNYIVVYINDKYHMFVFTNGGDARDAAYFEDNGAGGCELFLGVEQTLGDSTIGSFDLVVTNQLLANQDTDSKELVEKLEGRREQDQEMIKKAGEKFKSLGN